MNEHYYSNLARFESYKQLTQTLLEYKDREDCMKGRPITLEM